MAREALAGCRLKIARAEEHIEELETAIAPIRDPKRIRFIGERVPGTNKLVYKAAPTPVVDDAWRAIVGDVLTNLRAALDHLAWQLVILNGGTPKRGIAGTSFPIMKSAPTIPITIQPGISAEAAIKLDEIQPYRHPTWFGHHHLWLLNEFCNTDKHRFLLMMIAAPSLDEIWWGSAIGQEPQPATWFPGLGPDNEVASFDFGDNEPPTGFMPHLALTVTLDEPAMQSFPHTRDVVRFFRALSSYVKGTVNLRFGPLFDPQE